MIRKAKLEDVPEIMGLIKLTFEDDSWFTKKHAENLINIFQDLSIVFEENNKICGVLLAKRNWEEPEIVQIDLISVTKDKRREGIGSLLISEFEKRCKKDQNIKYILTDTENDNLDSINFFTNLGFKIVGFLIFYEHDKVFLGKTT